MMRARTFAKRADRRVRLWDGRLPRDVSRPGGQWRPSVIERNRVQFTGYGHVVELRSTGVLSSWHAYHREPGQEWYTLLTGEPMEFPEAFKRATERCEALRAVATAELTQAQPQTA